MHACKYQADAPARHARGILLAQLDDFAQGFDIVSVAFRFRENIFDIRSYAGFFLFSLSIRSTIDFS